MLPQWIGLFPPETHQEELLEKYHVLLYSRPKTWQIKRLLKWYKEKSKLEHKINNHKILFPEEYV